MYLYIVNYLARVIIINIIIYPFDGVSIVLYLLYFLPKLCQEDRGVTPMIISEIKKTKNKNVSSKKTV